MKRFSIPLILASFLIALNAMPAKAQYGTDYDFGPNKMAYGLKWQILSGEHVDVYYYPAEERIARMALAWAEESVELHSRHFNLSLSTFHHRPQIFVYASHQYFAETNFEPDIIPEGVAGVTEFLKERIYFPFMGSYSEFHHSLRHELVHYFQAEKIFQVCHMAKQRPNPEQDSTHVEVGSLPSGGPSRCRIDDSSWWPLWWMEGLAEHWSSSQDTRDDMFNADLIMHNKLPDITTFSQTQSYTVYPLGGEFFRYLETRFGDEKIHELYENANHYRDFLTAFKTTYKVDLDQLSREFEWQLQQRFFPLVNSRERLDVAARNLTTSTEFNFKPLYYDDSTHDSTGAPLYKVLYISPWNGYETIYRTTYKQDGLNNKLIPVRSEKLVQGGDSPAFESMHFDGSRLDVCQNTLAFVSKRDRSDALYFWDLRRNREINHFQFGELVEMRSPSFAPDCQRVVFVGFGQDGISDLYTFDVARDSLTRLTNDQYLEADPSWSPDGRMIVFASDRNPSGNTGSQNLFLIDLATKAIRPLTNGDWRDEAPRFSSQGDRILFSSDRDGIFNIYEVDTTGHGRKLTNYASGAFDPAYFGNDDTLLFMGYDDGNYLLYTQRINRDSLPAGTFALASDSSIFRSWPWLKGNAERTAENAAQRQYQPRFHLSLSGLNAAISTYGVYGSVAATGSDALNDHWVILQFSSLKYFTSSYGLNQWNSYNGSASYFDISHRLNWGFTVYSRGGAVFDATYRYLLRQNETGAALYLSWPLNRFKRLEFSTSLGTAGQTQLYSYSNYFEFDALHPDLLLANHPTCFVNRLSASLVKDNTLWLETGPISGARQRYTFGLATDLSRPGIESYMLSIDFRKYFRLSMMSAYAVGIFAYASDGALPERTAVGGSTNFRLYPGVQGYYGGLYGDHIWIVNQEIRFPLIHMMGFATPIGNIVFPGIQSAFFLDIGQFWLAGGDRGRIFGSYGVSWRMPLMGPYLILRLDLGKRFTFGNALSSSPFFNNFGKTRLNFGIGTNF